MYFLCINYFENLEFFIKWLEDFIMIKVYYDEIVI